MHGETVKLEISCLNVQKPLTEFYPYIWSIIIRSMQQVRNIWLDVRRT